MKRKLITLLLSLILFNSSVHAAGIIVDNKPIETDIKIIEGTAYIPIETILNASLYTLKWDNVTKSAIIINEDGEIAGKVKNGDTYLIDGDTQINFNVPIQIIDSKLCLPLRALLEATNQDFEIIWDDSSKTIILNSENKEIYKTISDRADMNDDIGLLNYSNAGLATVHNGYIYYSSSSEYDDEILFIYRMNLDGTNKTKIAAIPGYVDCTYLRAYSDELYFFNNHSTYNLYKININSGEFSHIANAIDSYKEDSSRLDNIFGNNFYLKDGFLYYIKHIYAGTDSVIYKKEISTGNEKEILRGDFYDFEIRGNKIYLSNLLDKFMKANLDGSGLEDDNLKICDNIIYKGKNYVPYAHKKLNNLFKNNSKETVNYSIINVKGNDVYFTTEYWDFVSVNSGKISRRNLNEEKSNRAIYKINIDSDSYTKITDGENISCITIAGDWIFYRDNEGKYMVKTDGSEKSKI